MPQPADGPAELEDVKTILGIDADDHTKDAELNKLIDALNVVVRGWPVAAVVDAEQWPANVSRGANLLAAQCRRVEGSPGGTAPATSADPVYVAYGDPTIVMLLKLNAPAVG